MQEHRKNSITNYW